MPAHNQSKTNLAVSPGPGSSADSYDEDEDEEDDGDDEVGDEKDISNVDTLEKGGKDGTKKESFIRKKRELNPLRWQSIPPVPETQNPSAEAKAGIFGHLTLSWVGPLMSVCQ